MAQLVLTGYLATKSQGRKTAGFRPCFFVAEYPVKTGWAN
jgi:hypothetical protein